MTPSVNESAAASSPSTEATPARRRVETVLATWAPGEAPETAAEQAPQRGDLVAPVQRVNEVMRPYGVEFELQEDSSRLITRLVDRETGELIRQIPAEEVLRVAERLEEVQGQLIREEA